MTTQKERMCTARAGWVASLAVCLFKILTSGVVVEGIIKFGNADLNGMALFLAAVGGIYWGRQDSKRKERMDNV